MRQASLIGLTTVLALFIGGCTGNDQDQQGTNTSVPPKPPASASPGAKQTPFAQPTETTKPPTVVTVAGLVQTLPPDARTKQAITGPSSRDPFAFVPVQPQVTVSPNPQAGQPNEPVPQPLPKIPDIPPPPQVKPGNSPVRNPSPKILPPPRSIPNSAPTTIPKPGTPGVQTPNQPPPFVPKLPELPEPTLAKGIEVTGVINVNGVRQAIVKVPNQPPQYVKEGDRLSNGQVLVKRIEMRGSTPVVILEQYGIEVAKRVGEKPTVSPGQDGTPTASGIVPSPLNTNALSLA